MKFISVIVPAFRPKSFKDLLISISNNVEINAEWIVVDDGSGSQFDDVFDSLPDYVRLVRSPKNIGQSAARNVGLMAATGKWVKFLDADDQLDKEHLKSLLEEVPVDGRRVLPFAPTLHVYPSGHRVLNQSWRELPLDPSIQLDRQIVRPFLHHCGALFPRSLLLKIGGYDESLVTDEDGDLLLRILLQGYSFKAVDKINYLYIHHGSNSRVSSDDDVLKLYSRVEVCNKLLESFSGSVPSSILKASAKRMDKIAVAYWSSHRTQAKNILVRANTIAPGYQPDIRMLARLIRFFFGLSFYVFLTNWYRKIKGQPKGGAQG